MKKAKKSSSAGIEVESSTNAEVEQVSQPIAKPSVSSRLCDVMPKFGKVHNMIARTPLSAKEYNPISQLFAEAKIELYNIYLDSKDELKNNFSSLFEQMIKEENESLGKVGFYNQYDRETHANNKYCLSIVKDLIERRFK